MIKKALHISVWKFREGQYSRTDEWRGLVPIIVEDFDGEQDVIIFGSVNDGFAVGVGDLERALDELGYGR